MNVAPQKDPVATLSRLRRPPLADPREAREARAPSAALRTAILAAGLFGPALALAPVTIYAYGLPLPDDQVATIFQRGVAGFQGIAIFQATRFVARWVAIGPWRRALRIAVGLPALVLLAALPLCLFRVIVALRPPAAVDVDNVLRTFATWCVISLFLVLWSLTWRQQGDRDVDPSADDETKDLRLADLLIGMAGCGAALAAMRFGLGFERLGETWFTLGRWSLSASIVFAPVAFAIAAFDFCARSAVRGETAELRKDGRLIVAGMGSLGALITIAAAVAVAAGSLRMGRNGSPPFAAAIPAAATIGGGWVVFYVVGTLAFEATLRWVGVQAIFHQRPSRR